MSVDVPDNITVNMGGSGTPLEAELSGGIGIGGTGTPLAVTVGGSSTPLGINITNIPKIQIGLDKVQVGLDKIQIGLDPLTLNLAIKEIPSVRAHFPANFSIGFTALGVKLFSIDLCGKGQLITEPYVPNFAERCGQRVLRPADNPSVVVGRLPSAADAVKVSADAEKAE